MSTENDRLVLKEFAPVIEYAFKWYEKKNKFSKTKFINEESIFEKAFRLDHKYDLILSILLCDPAINVMTICDYIKPNIDRNEYRQIQRQVKDLLKLDLISESDGDAEPIGKFHKHTIPYELTLGGIMYIILNFNIGLFIGSDPLKQLLENYNYPKNFLFKQFLYPYFTMETLLENLELRFELLKYLNRICKIIQQFMPMYFSFSDPELAKENLIDNSFIPQSLFTWPKSKKSDNINKSKIIEVLKRYLFAELELNWIKSATFNVDYQNDKIEAIDDDNNYLIITISSANKSANLLHKGSKYTNLFKLLDEKNSYSVAGKGLPIMESMDRSFLFSCKKELATLLFNLQYQSIKDKNLAFLLSKDHLYLKAIQELIDVLKIKDSTTK